MISINQKYKNIWYKVTDLNEADRLLAQHFTFCSLFGELGSLPPTKKSKSTNSDFSLRYDQVFRK
ncbi:hypothetical protein D1818_06015 [Aquimarina sp. BL5]|nr:hypothetical protein D1818_06015 [Aquimarina sp. BL5]